MQAEPYAALQWWTQDQPYDDLVQAFRVIEASDVLRRESLLRYVRLYGNSGMWGYTPFTHNQVVDRARVTMNVIKSVCDTAVSRLSRQRPKPRFLTHGGNWSLQRRARLLEQFTDQAFYQGGLYQLAPKILLDAAVLGTGCLKVYRKGREVQFERVFPGELFVIRRMVSTASRAISISESSLIGKCLCACSPIMKTRSATPRGQRTPKTSPQPRW